MKTLFAFLAVAGLFVPAQAWAMVTYVYPEIPPGTMAIVLAGLTAGVLLIRSRRKRRMKSPE